MRRISRITYTTLACIITVPVIAVTTTISASAHITPGNTGKVAMTYHGSRGSAVRITAQTPRADVPVSGLLTPTFADSDQGPMPQLAAAPQAAMNTSAFSPLTAPARSVAGHASVVASFNGISDLDSGNLNGHVSTPPDQGLCAGRDPSLQGNPTVIWEEVNNAAREIAPDGPRLRPDQTLITLFRDPFALGDVRCIWDPVTQSFIFSELGFPLATGPNSTRTNTTVDIAVLNRIGFASYQFDTSQGGTCLGDQPKLGFNLDSVIVSTDEFCGTTRLSFQGAIALVISLPQLVLERSKVNDSVLGPATLPGNIVLAMDPVYGPGLNTAYLVNSFPFNGSGNANLTANTLGFWTIANTLSVTFGIGSPTLTGTIIPSETYGFPVRATSTGTGAVVNVVNGRSITSEAFLNPNDSRINTQLETVRTGGRIQILANLDTALTPAGDTAVRDGVAWFQIDAQDKTVADQGYIAASGAYLLDPVIARGVQGSAVLGFAITSSTINPSAAFATTDSATVTIVAAGAGPHLSFADAPPFNRPRWGDYSAATVLPGNSGIWLATEYVPPAADQAPSDNWGTSVFEVKG
jgi:hypothetical protein